MIDNNKYFFKNILYMPAVRKHVQKKTGDSCANSQTIDAIIELAILRSNETFVKIKNEHDTLLREFNRFKELYDIVLTSLNSYLNYFRDASFNDLTTLFTEEVYTSLASLIVSKFGTELNYSNILSYDIVYDSGLFTHYKENSYKILDGLKRSLNLYIENQNQKAKILTCEEKEKILKDPKLLQEYIDTHFKNTMTLFQDISYNLTVLPRFKPQYEVYFERHGPPQEGVFDTEKLAVIIKELLDNGILTQDDVFES
tara:strand:+ start:13184 stop:13951 length:768 start_codon:yes stop_codon:yes gene_type:complete